MAAYLLDTNVLVRYLTNDHAAHFAEVKTLFSLAEKGEHALTVVPVVVAETTFVLESFYKIGAKQIAEAMQVLLSQRWLAVEERPVLLAAMPSYGAGAHFVDAYLLARSTVETTELFTFDKKLKRNARHA